MDGTTQSKIEKKKNILEDSLGTDFKQMFYVTATIEHSMNKEKRSLHTQCRKKWKAGD